MNWNKKLSCRKQIARQLCTQYTYVEGLQAYTCRNPWPWNRGTGSL